MVLFFCTIYMMACYWHLIASYSLKLDDTLNSIVNDLMEDDGTFSISRGLIRSIHFVLVTITTVGYGGIFPISTLEILYDVFLVVTGWFVYMAAIAFFAMMTSYSQFSRIEHTNLVKGTEFLLTKQHPNFVQSNRVISTTTTTTDEDAEGAHVAQKAKDEAQNHQLMLHLQGYYDFVLHHRDGLCLEDALL